MKKTPFIHPLSFNCIFSKGGNFLVRATYGENYDEEFFFYMDQKGQHLTDTSAFFHYSEYARALKHWKNSEQSLPENLLNAAREILQKHPYFLPAEERRPSIVPEELQARPTTQSLGSILLQAGVRP